MGRKKATTQPLSADVPEYQWDPWPFGLYTARQIKAMGYLPGQLAGIIPYSKNDKGYLELYTLIDAQPKPPLSEKRKAAIAKAQEAQAALWRCAKCGGRKQYRNATYCEQCDHEMMMESDHDEAALWARGHIEKGDFVILDTETTGLEGEIIELAVIDHQGNVLLNTRLKPDDYTKPNAATSIHGITPEMVADAPTFADIYGQLLNAVKGKTVIIYNRDFDVPLLKYTRQKWHLPRLPVKAYECAMLWYAQWYGDWSHYWESYKWQPLGGNHSALGDCRATLETLQAMAESETED